MSALSNRDDDPLTSEQLKRFARVGSKPAARYVRSMAQELLRRREWEAPVAFAITPAEQKIVEGIRELVKP